MLKFANIFQPNILALKQFTLFIIAICISITSLAQDTNIDSLQGILDTKLTTKHKVNILNQLNRLTLTYHDSLSLSYVQEAIELSKKIEYNKGLGIGYYYLGEFLFSNGAYDSAITTQLISLSIHRKNNDDEKMADNFSALGSIHNYQSNYATALDYYLKTLKIREENEDSVGVANCYNNIAIVHNYLGNYNKAIDYFNQSMKIRQVLGDERGAANLLNNIGIVYRAIGKHEKAREYYQMSLDTKLKLDDKTGISNAYNNIGITYFYQKNYTKALSYYLKSKNIREALQNKLTLSTSYLNIGEVYTKLNDVDKAQHYLEMALTLADETGSKDDKMLTYQILAELNQNQGKFEEALKNMYSYSALKDSIYNDTNNTRVAELQAKYEIDKKEKEIKLLQKENEIISIKENNNSVIRNIFIIVTIIISILIFAIMRSYWHELSNSKLLKSQKEEIELSNTTLKELNHEKDQLMRIVAHDLRSPLNQVEGLVKLISFDIDRLTNEQKESINRIKHAVNHSKELLTKILSARSLDSAELKLKLEKVDLKGLISEVVKGYEIAANNKNIKVNVDTSVDSDFSTIADINYAEQIVDNLLSNAIKFSPLEEKVDISLKKNNKKILLEIKDYGPGISEDDKPKLFGKYQKLSAQPTAGETSTGLGLSIVKKYVDVMNGKVWYENNNGKGSKFIVELDEA